MKYLWILVVFGFLSSCGHREFKTPDKVQEMIEQAGTKGEQLENVIRHFKDEGNVIKEEAAYFLIGNMKEQGYAIFKLVDSTGQKVDFDVLNYADYDALLDGWDAIEDQEGNIHFVLDTLIKDYDAIQADYLIKNIDLAYQQWHDNPWAQHLDFDQFCEYILPYRSSNEPIEEWRSYFINELSWVKDSIKDPSDPVEAACWVNDYIKSWFRFDPRYYEHPTDQGLAEIMDKKMGRCEDMTNIAIYAMRALAIPVMSDFTPYWANTGNNHAWNAILDKNDSTIIFMGGEANPGEYQLGHVMAKAYRKTFSIQEESLAEKLGPGEKAPPYLDKNSIRDVTPEYVPTTRIKIELNQELPDSSSFAYICVFNSGEWKAIDYTRPYGTKAYYSKMGRGIAYLPAFYVDREIIPAADAFILSDSGKIVPLIPNGEQLINVKLFSTTRRLTKETTDFVEQASFDSGKSYILYYWNNQWIEAGQQTAGNGPLEFRDVPFDALYWLVEKDSRKEERIFTIDEEGKQEWW